jgi:hypothetical protein
MALFILSGDAPVSEGVLCEKEFRFHAADEEKAQNFSSTIVRENELVDVRLHKLTEHGRQRIGS